MLYFISTHNMSHRQSQRAYVWVCLFSSVNSIITYGDRQYLWPCHGNTTLNVDWIILRANQVININNWSSCLVYSDSDVRITLNIHCFWHKVSIHVIFWWLHVFVLLWFEVNHKKKNPVRIQSELTLIVGRYTSKTNQIEQDSLPPPQSQHFSQIKC